MAGKYSPVDSIKEIAGQLKAFMRFDLAMTDLVSDHEDRLIAAEKILADQQRLIQSLDKRYSELLFAFKSYRSQDDR